MIVGVDAHEGNIKERLAWVKKRPDSGRFRFIHGEIQTLKFNEKFDVILLSHVIEHLKLNNVENVLNYLWSICEKQMIVETPNEFEDGRSAVVQYANPYQKHQSLIDGVFMNNHGFTPKFTYYQDSGFSNTVYIKERI